MNDNSLEKRILDLVSEVTSVAVVAHPHPKWDERPIAVCCVSGSKLPTPTNSALTAKIRELLAPHFAKYELIDEALIWPALPMTGTGKIDKKAIREKLQRELNCALTCAPDVSQAVE